jgi:hypothetical protein
VLYYGLCSNKKGGRQMKIIKKILIIAAAVIIGFIIGWRVTVCNGNISIDEANEHVGYFECFGQIDEYYID